MDLEKFLPWLLILLVIAGAIEMEMSAPSFVAISEYFNVSEKTVGLTISFNFLGFFIMSFFYGPLADMYSRKKILIIGNILGTIGALGCSLAPSMNILLFSRFIQGIGVASSMVLVPIIISSSYSVDKAAQLYRLNTGIITIFTALAPIMGGFINHAIGWRGNYGVVAFIQIGALILLIFLFKENKEPETSRINLKNILHNYWSVVSNFKFIISAIVPSLLYSSYLSFITYSAFLYIETFKLSDIQYSLHQAVIVMGFSLTSLTLGILKYDHKFWQKKLLCCGLVFTFTGALGIFLTKNANFTTSFMTILTMGNALIAPTIFAKAMSIFTDLRGTASSIIVSLRTLIIVCFTWLVSYLYNGTNAAIGLFLISIALAVTLMIIYLFKTNLFEDDYE